jgi:hypothetical protein
MASSRSAITGRFISRAAAARHPRTSVSVSRHNARGTHHRSAITGRYITGTTAARHPRTSVTERG